jgi:hypothetical protein
MGISNILNISKNLNALKVYILSTENQIVRTSLFYIFAQI